MTSAQIRFRQWMTPHGDRGQRESKAPCRGHGIGNTQTPSQSSVLSEAASALPSGGLGGLRQPLGTRPVTLRGPGRRTRQTGRAGSSVSCSWSSGNSTPRSTDPLRLVPEYTARIRIDRQLVEIFALEVFQRLGQPTVLKFPRFQGQDQPRGTAVSFEHPPIAITSIGQVQPHELIRRISRQRRQHLDIRRSEDEASGRPARPPCPGTGRTPPPSACSRAARPGPAPKGASA